MRIENTGFMLFIRIYKLYAYINCLNQLIPTISANTHILFWGFAMIHYDMPEPDISPDFTIGDIHRIREWNYERLKDATLEERREDTRKRIAPHAR
jgi:hypothetical protein